MPSGITLVAVSSRMRIEATIAPTAVPRATTPPSDGGLRGAVAQGRGAPGQDDVAQVARLTPQNSVVVASEIWPSLSRHRRELQVQKSGTSSSGFFGIGRISTPVCGMRVLNQAASA